MLDEERLSLEIKILKETVEKLEKQLDCIKTETTQLTSKYLEGFNKVLESQSENRSYNKSITNEFMALREKLILLNSAVDKLQDIDAYTEIKKFIDHLKNEKEISDFMMTTREFMTSAQQNIKILIVCAGCFATVLLGMLIQFITKLFGG